MVARRSERHLRASTVLSTLELGGDAWQSAQQPDGAVYRLEQRPVRAEQHEAEPCQPLRHVGRFLRRDGVRVRQPVEHRERFARELGLRRHLAVGPVDGHQDTSAEYLGAHLLDVRDRCGFSAGH